MKRNVNFCDPRSCRCHKTGPRALASRQGLPTPSLPQVTSHSEPATHCHTSSTSTNSSGSPAVFPCPLKTLNPRTLFRGWLRCHLLPEAASCPSSKQNASLLVPQPESHNTRSMVVVVVTVPQAPGPCLKYGRNHFLLRT